MILVDYRSYKFSIPDITMFALGFYYENNNRTDKLKYIDYTHSHYLLFNFKYLYAKVDRLH